MFDFIDTFRSSIKNNHPRLVVIHDYPVLDSVVRTSELLRENELDYTEYVTPTKYSHTQLWNSLIMISSTEWTLVCNDDIKFHKGWYEYLIDNLDKYLQINLQHYGGFCVSKRMILKLGWFDETLRGGGFEDVDWQLRIGESDLRSLVDTSMDNKLIGHYKMKYPPPTSGHWLGNNNNTRFSEKWGRSTPYDMTLPSYRKIGEIDWHPESTKEYSRMFNEPSMINEINCKVNSNDQVFI
jgi:hypothetical protein